MDYDVSLLDTDGTGFGIGLSSLERLGMRARPSPDDGGVWFGGAARGKSQSSTSVRTLVPLQYPSRQYVTHLYRPHLTVFRREKRC